MKKILTTAILVSSALFTLTASAATDKLNIAGIYKCTGYDSYVGAYTGVVELKLDAKSANFANNVAGYSFSLKASVPGDPTIYDYTGEAAAHGDLLAIYYANANPKEEPTDHGVGIATVNRVQDAKGNYQVSFNKFYFEPKYFRDKKGPNGQYGGTGTETCVRVNS